MTSMPPPSAKLSLLDLPHELIEEIARNLCRHCQETGAVLTHHTDWRHGNEVLSALCRTCRVLNNIATPVLYHRYQNGSKLRSVPSFLHTLIARPELGRHLRHISTIVPWGLWNDITKEDYHVFIAAAARLGVTLARVVENGDWTLQGDWVNEAPYETLLQLIIAHCPNLEALSFTVRAIYCEEGEGAFSLLDELAAQQPRKFELPHLRKFSFGHDDSGRAIHLENFAGLFALAPSLTVLDAGDCFGGRAPLRLDNVTSMRFRAGRFTFKSFRDVVTSSNQLESFLYESGGCAGQLGEVTPREAIVALASAKPTLKFLHLDCGGRERGAGMYEGPCPVGDQIPTLSGFSVLETFIVDGASVLFPKEQAGTGAGNVLADLLPASIQVFHLVDAHAGVVDQLLGLAQRVADFPALREVRVHGHPNPEWGHNFTAEELAALAEMFGRCRVDFSERSSFSGED